MSDDELASQGNVVVCPGCLMEFAGDASKPIRKKESPTETYNYGTSVTGLASMAGVAIAYCRFCGAQISEGCNFCPVCGNRLAVTNEAENNNLKPNTISETKGENKKAIHPQTPRRNVARQMPYMPSYRYTSFDAQGQYVPHKKKRASWQMYVVMVILAAVFVYLITLS